MPGAVIGAGSDEALDQSRELGRLVLGDDVPAGFAEAALELLRDREQLSVEGVAHDVAANGERRRAAGRAAGRASHLLAFTPNAR